MLDSCLEREAVALKFISRQACLDERGQTTVVIHTQLYCNLREHASETV